MKVAIETIWCSRTFQFPQGKKKPRRNIPAMGPAMELEKVLIIWKKKQLRLTKVKRLRYERILRWAISKIWIELST